MHDLGVFDAPPQVIDPAQQLSIVVEDPSDGGISDAMGGHLESGVLGAFNLGPVVRLVLQEEPARFRTIAVGLEQGRPPGTEGTVHVELDRAHVEKAGGVNPRALRQEMVEGFGAVAHHHRQTDRHLPRRLDRFDGGHVLRAEACIRDVGETGGHEPKSRFDKEGGQAGAIRLGDQRLQAVGRAVDEDPGQFAVRVAKELATEDLGLGSEPGHLEGHGIGPDRVAVHPLQHDRPVGKHRIQGLPPVGECLIRPIVLVPSATEHPSRGHALRLILGPGQDLLHGFRPHKVGGGEAFGVAHKMGMGIHEARHEHRPLQVHLTVGGISVEDGALRPHLQHAAIPNGDGLGFRARFVERQDEAVVQDEVGLLALEPTPKQQQGRGQDRKKSERKSRHGRKFAQRVHSAPASSFGFWIRGRRKRTVSPSGS